MVHLTSESLHLNLYTGEVVRSIFSQSRIPKRFNADQIYWRVGVVNILTKGICYWNSYLYYAVEISVLGWLTVCCVTRGTRERGQTSQEIFTRAKTQLWLRPYALWVGTNWVAVFGRHLCHCLLDYCHFNCFGFGKANYHYVCLWYIIPSTCPRFCSLLAWQFRDYGLKLIRRVVRRGVYQYRSQLKANADDIPTSMGFRKPTVS